MPRTRNLCCTDQGTRAQRCPQHKAGKSGARWFSATRLSWALRSGYRFLCAPPTRSQRHSTPNHDHQKRLQTLSNVKCGRQIYSKRRTPGIDRVGQQAKSCPAAWFCFVNKVLLAPGHAHWFRSIEGCLSATTAEFRSCNRGLVTHKAKNIYRLAFFRKKRLTSGLDLSCPRKIQCQVARVI